MSVLAIISTKNGAATKAGLEAASYAAAWARAQGSEAIAIAAGPLSNAEALGATGVARIHHHAEEVTDSGQWAKLATAASESVGAISVVASHESVWPSRSASSSVAVRLTAGLVAGVTELPENGDRSQKRVFLARPWQMWTYQLQSRFTPLHPTLLESLPMAVVQQRRCFSAELGSGKRSRQRF